MYNPWLGAGDADFYWAATVLRCSGWIELEDLSMYMYVGVQKINK